MLAHHRGQSYLHSCLLMWIADFQYRSKTCHLQKFFDTALIGCIKGGVELEYRVRRGALWKGPAEMTSFGM